MPYRVRSQAGVVAALVVAAVGAGVIGVGFGSHTVVSLRHAVSAANVVLTAETCRWMHDRFVC